MEIEKNTKVKVPYRPDLGTGSVLQVAEAHGGEYQKLRDVVDPG